MNRLSSETSPYLLQHKNNPVHWYAWGENAFNDARKENKPILLSIGYSSCHWCHVMEKESFEDEHTAGVMNELFINIKVDREEYPDVDHLYMDAVQAMTGSGGWPLNVFLTEDKKPFYGGTYFPPKPAHGRASWVDVLQSVSSFYHQHREEVEAQGDQLIQHLLQPLNTNGSSQTDETLAANILHKLLATADRVNGGFGSAPKFPSTHALQLLLLHYEMNQNKEALNHVLLSLDKMSLGGMYDVIGGGFSRYSTDIKWRIPHFEKMLYDNALLLELYSKAYHLTQQKHYDTICEETIQWILREMMSPEGGFYSALDADSEGVEGKFYTWDSTELREILQNDYSDFAAYYSVTEEGNWEDCNILYTQQVKGDISVKRLEEWKQLLYACRSRRIWPLLDDKILLSWNALMAKALIRCFLLTNHTEALKMAERNMAFLWNSFHDKETGFYHTYKNGQRKIHAYADDLAYWMDALIEYGHIQGDTIHYHRAGIIMQYLFDHYRDTETPLFCFTHKGHQQVVHNKPEIYDGATPSSNAIILSCLNKLWPIFRKEEWKEGAKAIVNFILPLAGKYPSSFGVWLKEISKNQFEEKEVIILGDGAGENYCSMMRNTAIFNGYFIVTSGHDVGIPGLVGKNIQGIYVCKNQACLPPVQSMSEALAYLQ